MYFARSANFMALAAYTYYFHSVGTTWQQDRNSCRPHSSLDLMSVLRRKQMNIDLRLVD